jgi:hypothetical protein
MTTTAQAIVETAAEVVLATLRRRARMAGGWMGCTELADELRLPKHQVKLALVRLGMEGLVERDVAPVGLRLAETWRAVMAPRGGGWVMYKTLGSFRAGSGMRAGGSRGFSSDRIFQEPPTSCYES